MLDVLNYAYLSAGPRGMNAVAELSSQYLRDWQDDPAADPVGWPPGWGPDPSAFRAGIDYTTSGLSDQEVRKISAWHQRMYGVIPRHVDLFARLHPVAYKLHRIRYEKSIGDVIPAQLIPLLTLQLATIRMQPEVMRQALHQARVLGARRHHVVQTIFAGLRQVMVDPLAMEATANAIDDLLAAWRE